MLRSRNAITAPSKVSPQPIVAFTQCGGGAKGSKEYNETKALYEKIEQLVNDATSCEELQEAAFTLIFSGLASSNYTDEEKMTESEEAKLEEMIEKLGQTIEEKSTELRCDEETEEEEIEEELEVEMEEVE